MRRSLRPLFTSLALIVFNPGAAPAATPLMKAGAAIGLIAEAHAWGDFCGQWKIDVNVEADFLQAQEIVRDANFASAYAPAFAKAQTSALKAGSARDACAKALEWFGPNGSRLPDLFERI